MHKLKTTLLSRPLSKISIPYPSDNNKIFVRYTRIQIILEEFYSILFEIKDQ